MSSNVNNNYIDPSVGYFGKSNATDPVLGTQINNVGDIKEAIVVAGFAGLDSASNNNPNDPNNSSSSGISSPPPIDQQNADYWAARAQNRNLRNVNNRI